MRRIVLAVLGGMMLPRPAGADEPTSAEPPFVDPLPPELRERVTEEAFQLGAELAPECSGEASGRGDSCRAYCAVSYAALCWRITELCTAATVVTLGGATIACAVAKAAACVGGAGLATICSGRCPP
jgi:hypothetical protein